MQIAIKFPLQKLNRFHKTDKLNVCSNTQGGGEGEKRAAKENGS